MNSLRIIFAGTPEFACPALARLIERAPPVAVLTQPDRPAGRGRKLTPSPVKRLAEQAGIEVLQPTSLKPSAAREPLAALAPDLLITAAYGLLLPRSILDLPGHGCWNLHASLLPRWRGASPIQQAILAGDRTTGITLMQMDPGLDTGPMLMTRDTPIAENESAGDLHDRLADLAAELLDDALDRLTEGRLPEARVQDDSLATHAPLIRKADACIDWSADADRIARQVRAFNPWPVAFGELNGLNVRVFRAAAEADVDSDAPDGTLLTNAGHADAIRVACGRGVLRLLELQAPGRKRLRASEWLNAHPDWRG